MDTFPSIPAMVQGSARRWGDAPAVVDGGARLTFRGVAEEMVRVARALIAVGIEPGDRVAIWAPNSIAWIPAALGIHAVGGVLVPLNTRLVGEEAAYILGKVDASLLLTVDQFLGTDYEATVRSADPTLRALERVVHLPSPGTARSDAWDGFLDVGASVHEAAAQARLDAVGPDDLADIIFTSGTTGRPKGVMLRHGASLQGYTAFNLAFGLEAGSRQLVIAPFFHCFGYKAGWMAGLGFGAVTYPVAVLDPVKVLTTISEERITHMAGSPTMFMAMLDHPGRDEFDVSSLDTALLSAATIAEQLVQRVRDELGVATTLTGYGLTENHAIVSLSLPTDPPATIASTAGRVLDGLEVRVVDDEGNDVEAGEPGELLLRGHLLMSGYYGDEDATADALAGGWLHTGDVATVSPDRYLTITDRKKDMYIMGGFNVAPAEVERVLLDMEGIAQVAVVGAPDERFGEVGVAFVVAVQGSGLTSEGVIAYAKEHLANYKVPRFVELVDGFPLNATGKVLKHELRASLSDRLGAAAGSAPT